ncbi:MAG: 4-alpha-glucanotransferase [Planctomycetota bacterium]
MTTTTSKPVIPPAVADQPFLIRSAGMLCHITSLPSVVDVASSDAASSIDWGCGDIGPVAHQFVDFLADAGQSLWQVLPLGPPAVLESPYSCYSAMAGHPAMISPEALVADGLVDNVEALSMAPPPVDRVGGAIEIRFDRVMESKMAVLRAAFDRFQSSDDDRWQAAFAGFETSQAYWLEDFALFESLARHFETNDWTSWPDQLPVRHIASLQQYRDQLRREVQFSKFVQFLFDRQWNQLKSHAKRRGIQLCGDMPIFVAHHSSDVWTHQSLFHLDEFGSPTVVAGVPPDYFSETGQRWGNPLYDWRANEQSNFAWWTARFRRAFEQFDLMRIDHFRGFESYWEVPAEEETAINGQWIKGPGRTLFDCVAAQLGRMPVIAEDLGLITEEVHHLRNELGFPGMRVAQFGFDSDETDWHYPETYTDACVAYTGTHDNDTTAGWLAERKFEGLPENTQRLLSRYRRGDDISVDDLVVAVLSSDASISIVPVQDYLGLGTEARINVPGKAFGNWAWRLDDAVLTPEFAQHLSGLVHEHSRVR